MKILLGNNTLALLAGSETWTYTLASQLKKKGHSVACFSPDMGIIADKLEEQGINCYTDFSGHGVQPFTHILKENISHDYDVIIANHFHIVEQLRNQFPKTPIISTIHGIIHFMDNDKWAPEHPATESGVNQFIAVSEETKELLRQKYNIDAMIIRNFFDLKRFGSLPAPSSRPKQFLVNTNYQGREDDVVVLIRETAKLMGAKVAALGANFTSTFETERAIKDSDVVFGMGRSVLEGVAAGRLGIVLGRWGYGGVINEANVGDIRFNNFSGRNAKSETLPIPEELKEQIEQNYQPHILDWGKKYMVREHNAAMAADEFIRLAEELTGEAINKPAKLSGVNPLAQPFKKSYAD